MAGMNKFKIPSLHDMDNLGEKDSQLNSLQTFHSHKDAVGKTQCSSKETSLLNPRVTATVNSASSSKLSHEAQQMSEKPVSTSTNQTDSPTQSSSSYPDGTSRSNGSRTYSWSTAQTNNLKSTGSDPVSGSQQTEARSTSCNKQTTECKVSEGENQVIATPRSSNSNALIVSRRQRGNPILKHVRNVPWEFGDIIPDYEMGKISCALFLSLRYHNLNPNYVHERLKQLGHSYDLRVLLVQVDVKDPHHSLRELGQMCILADCTLILAWTPEEAGRYLETYKSFENKPPDLIMEKTETNFLGQVTDCLTSVKKINKTDSMTLLSTFKTLEQMVKATEEDLSLCPGFGPQKAKKLHDAFHEPFLRTNKKQKKADEKNSSGEAQASSSAGLASSTLR